MIITSEALNELSVSKRTGVVVYSKMPLTVASIEHMLERAYSADWKDGYNGGRFDESVRKN